MTHTPKDNCAKLRRQINALTTVKTALDDINASETAIASVQIAIDELQDAYIAEVNFQDSNR